jgi:hypothetical protein
MVGDPDLQVDCIIYLIGERMPTSKTVNQFHIRNQEACHSEEEKPELKAVH